MFVLLFFTHVLLSKIGKERDIYIYIYIKRMDNKVRGEFKGWTRKVELLSVPIWQRANQSVESTKLS